YGDWSSDVCSSDLRLGAERAPNIVVVDELVRARAGAGLVKLLLDLGLCDPLLAGDIGNAAFCHQFLNSSRPRSSAQPGSAPPALRPPPPPFATAASGHLVEATGAGRPAPDTRRPRGPGAAGGRRRRWCRHAPP